MRNLKASIDPDKMGYGCLFCHLLRPNHAPLSNKPRRFGQSDTPQVELGSLKAYP